MKRIILSFLLVLSTYCFTFAQSKPNDSTEKQLQKLEWILGEWNRTNVRPWVTATETWSRTSKYVFEGIGVSMKGSDTTFVEKLRIEMKDDAVYYVADVKENATPTYFKITKFNDSGFVSENPEHDFPKMISYELKDGTLTAIISDGGNKRMGFVFQKN
ncbi:DUF6265 family protein [Roseivirga sp. E12]|uniref:DUF6265 family protein n=1 Tax=Roseivirga sp. E12 TaxID=2819237 RepID=UPI001ABC9F56|nr:DUF6265 family protein [Roseivirga sp. E12]MBO3697427.1 hypothetical protein [Roseivirga sp. E12]